MEYKLTAPDVYKRQLQWIGFIAALSFVIARLDQRKPFLPRDDPVSYTHLDVYKRQVP